MVSGTVLTYRTHPEGYGNTNFRGPMLNGRDVDKGYRPSVYGAFSIDPFKDLNFETMTTLLSKVEKDRGETVIVLMSFSSFFF